MPPQEPGRAQGSGDAKFSAEHAVDALHETASNSTIQKLTEGFRKVDLNDPVKQNRMIEKVAGHLMTSGSLGGLDLPKGAREPFLSFLSEDPSFRQTIVRLLSRVLK